MIIMQENNVKESKSSLLYGAQVISGILLVLLLGLHIIAQHFVVSGGLRDYQQVLQYVSNPILSIIEILFVIVVTFHAMVGIRSILLDLNLNQTLKNVLDKIIIIIAIITMLYGVYLGIALHLLATS